MIAGKYKPIQGWDDRYLISGEGEVVELRHKNFRGLDLQGKFVFLDTGHTIEKWYIHDLRRAAFGKKTTCQTKGIVKFLEEIKPRLKKEMRWKPLDGAVVVSFSTIDGRGKTTLNRMRLWMLEDAKAIFDIKSKYGRLFLKY